METKEIKVSRAELYERVWTTPMYRLAEEFGLSGRGLAKLCSRYEIPVPPRGFWEKLRHGKGVHRPSLPAWPGSVEQSIAISPSVSVEPSVLVSDERVVPLVRVAERLRNPHPLLAGMTERVNNRRFKITEPRTFHRIGRGKAVIDFPIGRHLLSRGIRIADALFRVFEERGWSVRPPDEVYRPAEFVVGALGQHIPVRLRERLKMLRQPGEGFTRCAMVEGERHRSLRHGDQNAGRCRPDYGSARTRGMVGVERCLRGSALPDPIGYVWSSLRGEG